jgi:choline dehydrogenase-like flavoprotein
MTDPVVIVGAGTAGCVVASRMSQDPTTEVILLEAGPDLRSDRMPDALGSVDHLATHAVTERWRRRSTVDGPDLLSGRGVGGSAAVNGMLAMWPPREDLDTLAGGLHRWSAAEREPSMERVQSTLAPTLTGRSRWGALSRALAAAAKGDGVDAIGDHNTGASGIASVHLAQHDQRRFSIREAYLEPARARSNLTVGPDAQARRVRIVDNAAVGVELDDGTLVDASKVILAAGAIETPVLLQRSGVTGSGIGRNLHDHLSWVIRLQRREPAARSGVPSGWAARWRQTAGGEVLAMPVEWLDDIDQAGVLVMLLTPTSRGLVAANADGSVSIAHRWSAVDAEVLLGAVHRVYGWLEAVASIATPVDPPRSLDEFARAITTVPASVFHSGGTCRMGDPDDPDTVVDEFGRVLGYSDLLVADASLLPGPVRAPPMLTVALLAEHLTELWGLSKGA